MTDKKFPAVHMYVGDIGSHFVQLFKRSDIGLALLMCRGCVANLLLFLRLIRIGRAGCQGRRPGHTKGAPALLPGKQQVWAGKWGLSGEGGWLEIRVSREPLGMWKWGTWENYKRPDGITGKWAFTSRESRQSLLKHCTADNRPI